MKTRIYNRKTDHQDAFIYLHKQHLLHLTNRHYVSITQIKTGHKADDTHRHTTLRILTDKSVTRSDKETEYPLQGDIYTDIQPDIYEL